MTKDKNTLNAAQTAAVYLQVCGGLPADRQLEALTDLLTAAFHSGVNIALGRAKEVYSSLHPGGCRLLSRGDACRCFLCQMDDLRGTT